MPDIILHDIPFPSPDGLLAYPVLDNLPMPDGTPYRARRLTFSESLLAVDVTPRFIEAVNGSHVYLDEPHRFYDAEHELADLELYVAAYKEGKWHSPLEWMRNRLDIKAAREIKNNLQFQIYRTLRNSPPFIDSEVVPAAKEIAERAFIEHVKSSGNEYALVNWDRVESRMKDEYDKLTEKGSRRPGLIYTRLTPMRRLAERLSGKTGYKVAFA